MATAWLLTTEGLVAAVSANNSTLRATIEQLLGSDLIGCLLIVPGIYIWTDLLAPIDSRILNAAALGLVDALLLDMTVPTLPRIRGDVVLAARTAGGEPSLMGRVGVGVLRSAFPTAI